MDVVMAGEDASIGMLAGAAAAPGADAAHGTSDCHPLTHATADVWAEPSAVGLADHGGADAVPDTSAHPRRGLGQPRRCFVQQHDTGRL